MTQFCNRSSEQDALCTFTTAGNFGRVQVSSSVRVLQSRLGIITLLKKIKKSKIRKIGKRHYRAQKRGDVNSELLPNLLLSRLCKYLEELCLLPGQIITFWFCRWLQCIFSVFCTSRFPNVLYAHCTLFGHSLKECCFA